jgi:DNA-binding NarL/FixJ family response regulator
MEYEFSLDLARAGLSESDFLEEQAIGQAMSMDKAVDFALNLPGKSELISSGKKVTDLLTSREREVVLLIAKGRSNREIAAELVLSPRTVEKHVANILSKLSFTSRSQIVRWAVEHGLLQTSG